MFACTHALPLNGRIPPFFSFFFLKARSGRSAQIYVFSAFRRRNGLRREEQKQLFQKKKVEKRAKENIGNEGRCLYWKSITYDLEDVNVHSKIKTFKT